MLRNTMTLNDIDWHFRCEKVAAKKKENKLYTCQPSIKENVILGV